MGRKLFRVVLGDKIWSPAGFVIARDYAEVESALVDKGYNLSQVLIQPIEPQELRDIPPKEGK